MTGKPQTQFPQLFHLLEKFHTCPYSWLAAYQRLFILFRASSNAATRVSSPAAPSGLCQTVFICHLLPGWGIPWDAERWMLEEALTTALLLYTSQGTNNWKQDNWAQDPFGLIQYGYSYTLKNARICFLISDTWGASQLKFHTVWSFVCCEITHSFPVGTLKLSCSSFSPVNVSLYCKEPLPFFADPLYCSPAAWGV